MGAAPLSWLAKIGGDTLKTKAKLLSSAINELHDDGFKKRDIVGLDYIKAATTDDLKNKVPEANAVKELNSNLSNLEGLALSQTVTINSKVGQSLNFEFNTDKKRILAFRGVDISNGNVVISAFAVTGDKTVRVDVLNTYSSALTVSVSAYVLVSDF